MTHTDIARDSAVDLLADHPWIARVDVVDDVLRLVVAEEAISTVRRPDDGAQLGGLVAEHLDHWAEVYDWTYTSSAPNDDADLAGWRATDTGGPLPAEHMAEWADRTVDLVLSQHPRHVLELGCGTGLLMRRLLPHVSTYIGTDVSAQVVRRLADERLDRTRFVQAGAHELRSTSVSDAIVAIGAVPDCILLNSVTQCFGDYSYLAAVVLDALDTVAPGGTVIVGDVRDAARLSEFARWAEQVADPDADEATVADRAVARAAADTEMCLDPATLASLARACGREVSVLAHAKTLAMDSELTRYRFDGVLVSGAPTAAPRVTWSALTRGAGDTADALDSLRERLSYGPVVVTGIEAPITGADLYPIATTAGGAVLVDAADPTALTIALPPTAGAVVSSEAAQIHEPLGAFARGRVTEVARRLLRRSGLPVSARIDVVLPSGRAQDLPAVEEQRTAIDRAGRCAVSGSEEPVSDTALFRVPQAVDQLDALATDSMCAFLRTSGIRAGAEFTVDELLAVLRVAPRHAWIVRRWLRVLSERGRVGWIDDVRATLIDDAFTDPTPDARALTRACRGLGYPAQMATFYLDAIAALGPLLRDEISAQSLLFPDGDLATSLGKDENNLSNRYLHGCVAAILAEAARSRPGPLRVLELGGGAGGGTAAALAALAGHDVDYLFTDVSRFFTEAAQERFGDRPGFRTAVVDIDRPLVDQCVDTGTIDVVIAANVLHCARSIDASTAALEQVLATGGLAVVVEAVREHIVVLLTMQFLLSGRDGAPHPGVADSRAGTDSVFCSATDLRVALSAAGMPTVLELPSHGTPLALVDQRLIVSQRHGR